MQDPSGRFELEVPLPAGNKLGHSTYTTAPPLRKKIAGIIRAQLVRVGQRHDRRSIRSRVSISTSIGGEGDSP